MASVVTLVGLALVGFGALVLASYAGTTLALRAYFEDERPEWVRIEE